MPAACATLMARPVRVRRDRRRRGHDDRLGTRADERLRCADVRVARPHVHLDERRGAEALGLDAGADHDEALGLVVLPVRAALGEARVADDADDLVALDELPRERRLLRGVELLVVEDVLIGRPWMPPLSLTQSKYAFATLPIVVKSTPGISMSMPPILIGRPVAFLPVPRPQTDFVADALPDPTGAVCAPAAQPASISAITQALAAATPIIVFIDRMDPSIESLEVVLTESRGHRRASRLRQGLTTCTLLASACLRAVRLRAGREERRFGARDRARTAPRERCAGRQATARRHRFPLSRPGY